MPDLSELFSQARDLDPTLNLEDEKVRNSVFEAFKKGWPGLYQKVVNLGFGAAQTRFDEELKTERGKREKAETDLHALQEQVKNKQEPEVKQINEQWQAKLNEETGKLTAERDQARAEVRTILLERDQEALRGLLVGLGVPKANAKGIAYDPTLLPKRGEYGEDKSLTVYQAGQRIPLMPGSGQTMLDALAHELVATPEVKEILISNGDAGGGITGGRSQGPANGDQGFLASIKKNAEAERAAEQPRVTLKERIKNR